MIFAIRISLYVSLPAQDFALSLFHISYFIPHISARNTCKKSCFNEQFDQDEKFRPFLHFPFLLPQIQQT